MLDSPEGVYAGQAGFEYPATSVPFSNYGGGQRGWPLRRLTCTNAETASPHLIAP
jgi:hypothetical protein